MWTTDHVIRIEGGLPALAGTDIIMPVLAAESGQGRPSSTWHSSYRFGAHKTSRWRRGPLIAKGLIRIARIRGANGGDEPLLRIGDLGLRASQCRCNRPDGFARSLHSYPPQAEDRS
jgi:hypothetical protein